MRNPLTIISYFDLSSTLLLQKCIGQQSGLKGCEAVYTDNQPAERNVDTVQISQGGRGGRERGREGGRVRERGREREGGGEKGGRDSRLESSV